MGQYEGLTLPLGDVWALKLYYSKVRDQFLGLSLINGRSASIQSLNWSSGSSAEKLWRMRPIGFAASGLPSENPLGSLTLPLSTVVGTLNTLLRGQFFQPAPRIFNSRFHTTTSVSDGVTPVSRISAFLSSSTASGNILLLIKCSAQGDNVRKGFHIDQKAQFWDLDFTHLHSYSNAHCTAYCRTY